MINAEVILLRGVPHNSSLMQDAAAETPRQRDQ
jgi:hypothetical protein